MYLCANTVYMVTIIRRRSDSHAPLNTGRGASLAHVLFCFVVVSSPAHPRAHRNSEGEPKCDAQRRIIHRDADRDTQRKADGHPNTQIRARVSKYHISEIP